MSTIKLIKNRSDIGAGTRGADMGIDAIEIAAINQHNDYFNRYDFVDVPTENESVYDKVKFEKGKRIEFVVGQCTRLAKAVSDTLTNHEFPLVLSGDHSSALGTISGIKAAYPEKTLGVIWIDAHADLHSPLSSPSGNVHGMPLAAALGNDNEERQVNKWDSNAMSHWNDLKNIGHPGPKLKPEHLVFFGVRDTEEPEDFTIQSQGIRNYKVDEMRYRGYDVCLNEAINTLKDCDHIYISFDVDAMDCDLISHGTGTPVSQGFTPDEVIEIISKFIETEKVSCLEFVEVNPLLDEKGNKMAETAFDVLKTVSPLI
ncbi:MAG: arginase [Flavobacteriaceae bacterium]